MRVLREYQQACVDAVVGAVRRGVRRQVCVLWPSLGKDQRVDQRVLTPVGWREIGSLHVGDSVIASDGKPTEVIGVHPQGKKMLYRVTFSDGTYTITGPDHLWKVRTKHDRNREKWRIVPTCELMDSRICIMLPLVEPIEYGESYPDLPIDPYALGVLLGDGSFGHGKQRSICITTPEPEILMELRLRIPGMELKHSERYSYRLNSATWLRPALLALELWDKRSWQKFIPEMYAMSSAGNRLALLRGLMDTDGTNQDFSGEFSTSSPQLASDVVDLVRSLGGFTKMKVRQPWFTYRGERREGRDSYRIFVRLPNGVNPFSLPRKADKYVPNLSRMLQKYPISVDPEGVDDSVCISVAHPDHLYVTEGYTLTHNSVLMAHLPQALSAKRTLVLAHTTELVSQLRDTFSDENPDAEVMIERAEHHDATEDTDIVVGCIPTLRQEYRRRKFKKPFDLILVDETDLALAKTWLQTIHAFGGGERAVLVGFTGTFNRADGKKAADLFDELVFEMGWEEALNGGWIVPHRGIAVHTATDISQVPVFGDDFSQEQLLKAVDTPDRNDVIVSTIEQQLVDRNSIIVFVSGIEQCERVAQMLRDRGQKAEAIHGKTNKFERPSILSRVQRGDTRILVNVGVVGRGVNMPILDTAVMAHPTRSWTRFTQAMSRCGRPSPETMKTDALLVDIVDVCGRHQVQSASSVFGCRRIDALGQNLQTVKAVEQCAEAAGIEVQDGDTVTDIVQRIGMVDRVVRAAIPVTTQVQAIEVFKATAARCLDEPSEFPWIAIKPNDYWLWISSEYRARMHKDEFGVWSVDVWNGKPLGGENLGEMPKPPFRDADRIVKRLAGKWTTQDGYDVPRWKGISKKTKRWSSKPTSKQLDALRRFGFEAVPPDLTSGKAQALMSAVILRREARVR